MFWAKNKKNRPAALSAFLSRQIANGSYDLPAQSDHWVKYMSVEKPHTDDENIFDVRIFDENLAVQGHVKITDYASLEEHPDLIIFEGWYNKKTKKAEIKHRKAA